MKRNKLVPARHEMLMVARCIERGCPFPREAGVHTCLQHTRMINEPQRFTGQSTLQACQEAWHGVMIMAEK